MSLFRKLSVAAGASLLALLATPSDLQGRGFRTAPAPLPGTSRHAELPEKLSETGLYVAGSLSVHPDNLAYSPQYPLWSDGAGKRRWLRLPVGTTIDASRTDAWQFPPGTRLWKEFGYDRPVETRYIERLHDGTWRYASYVWNEQGTDAVLAPAGGIVAHPAKDAPGGRYTIPSRDDCLACHEGAPVPVLGISALQLSPDRDPGALRSGDAMPGEVSLYDLYARGQLSGLSPELLTTSPRIRADNATTRAALGYLHANCGHCHNAAGPLADMELRLLQGSDGDIEATRRSLLGVPSEFHARGQDTRVVAGSPDKSVLALRMRSRNPVMQMPPLGSRVADAEGVALIERWIQQESKYQQELVP